MKNSEILRRARTHIESGEESFICRAIGRVLIESREEYSQRHSDLRWWVMELLEGSNTYNSWLEINYPERFAAIYALPVVDRQRALRPGRLAWMDWMIAYWEAKGE